jgi:hypothetical protein
MAQPRRESRQRYGITARRRPQPTFATKSARIEPTGPGCGVRLHQAFVAADQRARERVDQRADRAFDEWHQRGRRSTHDGCSPVLWAGLWRPLQLGTFSRPRAAEPPLCDDIAKKCDEISFGAGTLDYPMCFVCFGECREAASLQIANGTVADAPGGYRAPQPRSDRHGAIGGSGLVRRGHAALAGRGQRQSRGLISATGVLNRHLQNWHVSQLLVPGASASAASPSRC